MNQSYVAAVRLAVVVLGGMLLAACEATTSPSAPPPPETAGPVGTLSTQAEALQATSSYLELRARPGGGVVKGNTCGAANEVSSTCGNSGGAPDSSFRWIATEAGNYSFTTESSLFDTVLQLSPWGSGVSLGCNDNHAGTAQSAVTVYLPANTAVRITVDGANGTCGDFQLNITHQAANCGGSTCLSPPSACTESVGTCSTAGSCYYAPRPAGSACDDGNACTSGDACNSGGACVGNAITCNSPPGQCYQATGTCSGGSCSYAPLPYGSACSDGNSCTTGEHCNGSGGCNPGSGSCCPAGYHACNGDCCNNRFEFCNGDFCESLSGCGTSGNESIEQCMDR